MKQCNELIQGIKVIKLLAWESFQAKTITDIRKKEITLLFKLAGFRAMFSKYLLIRKKLCPYCKNFKDLDTRKIAVIILKFEQCGFTIE